MGVTDSAKQVSHETALRARVLAGDTDAWRLLYESHFESLYAYAYHRSGRDANRTDDVVQNSWMVAVRRLRSFQPGAGSFESWLRGICDNALRNERRRWHRKDRRTRSLSVEDGDAALAAEPYQRQDGRELAEQIALALTALPAPYQSVLRAKYEERMSVVEIAGRSGSTVKSAESLLSRARAAFRKTYDNLLKET